MDPHTPDPWYQSEPSEPSESPTAYPPIPPYPVGPPTNPRSRSQGQNSQGQNFQGQNSYDQNSYDQNSYDQNSYGSYSPANDAYPRRSRPSQPQPPRSRPHSPRPHSPQPPAPRRPPAHFSMAYWDEEDEFVPVFRPRPYSSRREDYRLWILGGVLLVGLTVLIEPTRVISSIVKTQDYDCQEIVQPQSVLSREQLTQLLTIPERSPKEKVRAIIREPYCLLPSLKIRAGVSAVREAYPLEADPDTWIVLLYEGDEYAGYRFNAR